jgi:hypothetical protein
MHFRRTLILAGASAFVVACAVAPAQNPPTVAPTATRPAAPFVQRDPRLGQMPQPIQPPADPAKVKGTYEIGGARVSVTDGDFYAAAQRLEKLEPKTAGRAVDTNRVWEHILAFAEAKALGLEATDDEVALFDPLAANPALAQQVRARYEREGITQEMHATYQRESRSIQKLRDLFANNARILSSEIFDGYRRDHYTVRLDFVEFPTPDYEAEMRAKLPTEDELRAFWQEDRLVQTTYMLPMTVTAEFVSFDPTAAPAANGPESSVSDAEALAFYKANKVRLDGMLTAEQRATLYPAAKVEVEQLATPFRVLRPVIEREMKLSGTIRAAFDAAKKPGADFAAIARANGLTYEKIEGVDRETMVTKYARYGHQAFSLLMNMPAGSMSHDLKMEPQLHYFFKLVDKQPSRLPEFEAVKGKIVDAYYSGMAYKRAQGEAQAMRSWLDGQVDAAVRAEEETLLAAATAAADAEAKAGGVTQEAEIEKIRQRHRAQAGAEVRKKRDTLASRFFDAYVKDHGLKVQDTGPFEIGQPRAEIPGGRALAKVLIKGMPQIRSMEVGNVSSILTDAATKTPLIARMAERAEPDYSKMSESDLLSMRSQAERINQYKPIQRWLYAEISKRRDLQIQQ